MNERDDAREIKLRTTRCEEKRAFVPTGTQPGLLQEQERERLGGQTKSVLLFMVPYLTLHSFVRQTAPKAL